MAVMLATFDGTFTADQLFTCFTEEFHFSSIMLRNSRWSSFLRGERLSALLSTLSALADTSLAFLCWSRISRRGLMWKADWRPAVPLAGTGVT